MACLLEGAAGGAVMLQVAIERVAVEVAFLNFTVTASLKIAVSHDYAEI